MRQTGLRFGFTSSVPIRLAQVCSGMAARDVSSTTGTFRTGTSDTLLGGTLLLGGRDRQHQVLITGAGKHVGNCASATLAPASRASAEQTISRMLASS